MAIGSLRFNKLNSQFKLSIHKLKLIVYPFKKFRNFGNELDSC